MSSGRTLERRLDAEKRLLGALLVSPDGWDDAGEVRVEDFYRDAHKEIYGAMLRLRAADRPVADLGLLKDDLTRVGKLDDVGGLSYVMGLTDGVPRASNVAHYAEEVRTFATLEGLEATARKMLRDAEAGEQDAASLIEETDRAIHALRGRKATMPILSPQERARDTYALLESIDQGTHVRGVTTGIRGLDDQMRGLHPGHLVVVAARPGMGKTALLLTMAAAAGDATKTPALLFSVEMAAPELNIREVALRAQVDSWRLQHGRLTPPDYAKVSAAIDAMAAGGVWVVDAPVLTVSQIRAMARRAHAARGLSMVGIDYLQLLTPERGKGISAENRTLEVAAMTRALKGLARDLGVPVVLLSQLSRAVEARADKRPMLSDLRDSGSIEQDADEVLFVFRPWVYDRKEPEHAAEVIVSKQRQGPIGIVKVAFLASQTRFADWTER